MNGTRHTDSSSGPSPDPLAIDAPDRSAADQAIQVRVTGARPQTTVEFEALLLDNDATIWRTHATFTANGDGIVDLTRHAPDAGSWKGVEPMAWLWAMTPDSDAMGPTFDDTATIGIDLSARTEADQASRTVNRERNHPDVVGESADSDDIVGMLFEPPDGASAPAVIELHGSGGRRSHRTARLLATHGYTVLALDYVGGHPGLPDHIANIDLSYFDTAASWLLDQSSVSGDQIGLLGASRGAEAAILLGAHRDWVGAVISYAGSGVPWDTPRGAPAWLDQGEPVPHIVAAENHPNKTNLDAKPLDDRLPPVEQTGGPTLLLSGGSDPVWDARRLSDIVVDRLDEAEFAHDYAHLTYDDVGHYIGIPYVPLGGMCEGDQLVSTAHAGEDSWPVVLDFLETGLSDSN